MSVRLYMDVHVRAEITVGLRRRGLDVITAQQDGAAQFDDAKLLTHASAIGRPLFSQDADLLAEAVARQRRRADFAGVIYAHQLAITVGQCIDDLELICKAMDEQELMNRIVYLPLR